METVSVFSNYYSLLKSLKEGKPHIQGLCYVTLFFLDKVTKYTKPP